MVAWECCCLLTWSLDIIDLLRGAPCPRILSKASMVQATLNDFMSLGRSQWTEARRILTYLLSQETSHLRDNSGLRSKALILQAGGLAYMHCSVAD